MALLGKATWERITGKAMTGILPVADVVPEKLTISYQIKEFMASENTRLKNGLIGLSSINNVRRDIEHLQELSLFPEAVSGFSVDLVRHCHSVLSNLDLAKQTRKMRWTTFQRVVEHCCNAVGMAIPSNLRSKKFRFGSDSPTPLFWTVQQWQETYNRTDDVGKLILCLASNCGMYSKDMASSFIVKGNLLTYLRTKREGKQDKMTYTLWPETQALLQSHGHLLKDMYSEKLEGNKLNKQDRIGSYIKKLPIPIKQLRHSSAQAITDSMEWHTYHDCFLQHSEENGSNKHYRNRSIPSGLFTMLHDHYFPSKAV